MAAPTLLPPSVAAPDLPLPRFQTLPAYTPPVLDKDPQRVLKVGLIGFGRTGRDVAKLLLTDKSMCLDWVIRRSDRLEHRSVPEFLGVDSDEPGIIRSASEFTADDLLNRFPVDVIIDFSSETGLDYYADAAARRRIAVVTAISRYSDSKQRQLDTLAQHTRVLWSPNITLGINFMLLAAQTLQRIAPGVDIQIVEEHFRDKAEVSGTALRLARTLDVPDDEVHVIRAGSSAFTRSCSDSPPRWYGCGMRRSPVRRSAMARCSRPGTSSTSQSACTGWRTSSCPTSPPTMRASPPQLSPARGRCVNGSPLGFGRRPDALTDTASAG